MYSLDPKSMSTDFSVHVNNTIGIRYLQYVDGNCVKKGLSYSTNISIAEHKFITFVISFRALIKILICV